MKLKLGKTLLKALEAGGSAAAATAVVDLQTTGALDAQTCGIVGVIVGLLRAIVNVVKVVKQIRSKEPTI